MRIATWNVNSVRARLPRVIEWLERTRPDVVCLQEIKCLDDQFPWEPLQDAGYNCVVHGQKTYNGVAILARRRIEDVLRKLNRRADAALEQVLLQDCLDTRKPFPFLLGDAKC